MIAEKHLICLEIVIDVLTKEHYSKELVEFIPSENQKLLEESFKDLNIKDESNA